MTTEPMSIEGAWVCTPRRFDDDRGTFLESYRAAELAEATGRTLEVAQVNTSVSRAGVVRGIHFADVPPSQAKYVSCPVGAIWDVVVDIRTGSRTFGRWEAVLLDDVDRRSVFLSEGLGHGFVSLVDGSTAVYLCSTPYAPGREHGVDPFDTDLGIDWPRTGRDGSPLTHIVSDKDREAPSLALARDQGLLPSLADVRAFLAR
ncbi:dTDP-4-dehydrorhamnose 3,5-epimerase family protein [Actinotalea caeni]|uniref:dTDP-4-dehydrorhamnose 3,5-epimerase family protein n=1 Tax=Actinotalea caeni TaxID=1348467 RepID=UPI0012E283D5|nr:dTDP-4-dehydrorhamnose 3,5-epimerase [Actinotalea caeni]